MRRRGKALKQILRVGFGIFLAGLFFTFQIFSCPVVNNAIVAACVSQFQNHPDPGAPQPVCESPCCHKTPDRDAKSNHHDNRAATHSCCRPGGTAAPLAVPVAVFHADKIFLAYAIAFLPAPTPVDPKSPLSFASPPKPDTPLYLLRLQLLI